MKSKIPWHPCRSSEWISRVIVINYDVFSNTKVIVFTLIAVSPGWINRQILPRRASRTGSYARQPFRRLLMRDRRRALHAHVRQSVILVVPTLTLGAFSVAANEWTRHGSVFASRAALRRKDRRHFIGGAERALIAAPILIHTCSTRITSRVAIDHAASSRTNGRIRRSAADGIH